MGAVVAFTGRLVDIAANLTILSFDLTEDDREQLRKVTTDLAGIRASLLIGRAPNPLQASHHSQRVPLLHELIVTVFT